MLVWVFQRLLCILLQWQISSLNLCLYFLVESHMPVGERNFLGFPYLFTSFNYWNEWHEIYSHIYSWVSVDSVTTYEGLIVFHRSRALLGIGTCWHLPRVWRWKAMTFVLNLQGFVFSFLSVLQVFQVPFLWSCCNGFYAIPIFFPLTGLSSVCGLPHWVFLFACMKCSIIAVGLLSSVFREKGLSVSVLGSEGSLSMCVSVLLYTYMNVSVHLCIVVFWNKWNWVQICSPGWEVFILLQVNIWTCPCSGSCVSEGPMLVLLQGYLGTVNWSPSWLSRLLEFGKPRDPHQEPPKTHLLIVPLPCWQHLESSMVIRRLCPRRVSC